MWYLSFQKIGCSYINKYHLASIHIQHFYQSRIVSNQKVVFELSQIKFSSLLIPDGNPAGWEYWDESSQKSQPEFLKIDEGWEVINETDKFLIYATGTKTWVPHQVLRRICFQMLYKCKNYCHLRVIVQLLASFDNKGIKNNRTTFIKFSKLT